MTTTLLDDPKAGQTNSDKATRTINDEESKYLTFKLADEEYGVEILKVRELIGIMNITSVPRMPTYMKGVINLRGKVIPVVDLRLKFALDEIAHTEQTCIIVVDVGKEVGIIVDTVSEVLDIAGENVEPPPAMGGSVDTSFILGMGKVGDAVKILLDIDKVLTTEELIDVAGVTEVAAETESTVGTAAQDASV
ncbi:MAG: purine-binding chemotaxis protein CheW [Planctomycetes bacterium]|nr:purine-binding chemotaxis protein CheW [Planctomycetota bacterium]